jgi:hypothetical protein
MTNRMDDSVMYGKKLDHGADRVEDVEAREVAECQGRTLFVHLLYVPLPYGKAWVLPCS